MIDKEKGDMINPVYYKSLREKPDLRKIEKYKNILPNDYSPDKFNEVYEKMAAEIVEFAISKGLITEKIEFLVPENIGINGSNNISSDGTRSILCDALLLRLLDELSLLILDYKRALTDGVEQEQEISLLRLKTVLDTIIKQGIISQEIEDYCEELYLKNDSYSYQAVSITNAMIIFIICHEIGHLACQHKSSKFRNLDYEFEADKIACHLYFQMARRPQNFYWAKIERFALRAPLLLLDILEIKQECKDLLNNIDTPKYNEFFLRKANLLSHYGFSTTTATTIIYIIYEETLIELRKYLIKKIEID